MPTAEICILTNGTLITETTASKLQAYSQVRFQVSLDGPDSNRHDQIRGAGNFEKALRGIRVLREHRLTVNVLSVLSAKTAPWMEDFFRLAVVEGFDSMNFIRFVPEGYGRRLLEASEDQPLIGFKLKAAMENIIRLMAKYGVRSHIQAPLYELVAPGLGRSGRFWESIVVDYQGFVIASSRSKLRLGHALHDGLEKVFAESEIFKSLRRGKVDGCGSCPLYSVCGGDRNAAYAATGDFLGKDPGCWIEKQQTNERKAL
jgi:radical SAM protein with 4Fe4S-binding SPASM domain